MLPNSPFYIKRQVKSEHSFHNQFKIRPSSRDKIYPRVFSAQQISHSLKKISQSSGEPIFKRIKLNKSPFRKISSLSESKYQTKRTKSC